MLNIPSVAGKFLLLVREVAEPRSKGGTVTRFTTGLTKPCFAIATVALVGSNIDGTVCLSSTRKEEDGSDVGRWAVGRWAVAGSKVALPAIANIAAKTMDIKRGRAIVQEIRSRVWYPWFSQCLKAAVFNFYNGRGIDDNGHGKGMVVKIIKNQNNFIFCWV